MKKAIVVSIALALFASIGSSTVMAQEVPASQIYWVNAVKVIPSQAQEYEAASKELLELYKKHNFSAPFYAYTGTDSTYRYWLPMPDYATLDSLWGEYRTILEKEGAKAQRILKRIGDSSNGEDTHMVGARPDLSYVPESPTIKSDEITYMRLNRFHLKNGTLPDAEAVLKKCVELFKINKVKWGYNVAASITGTNLPFYGVAMGAKSATDFWSQNTETTEALGAEFQAIVNEWNALLRSTSSIDLTRRPDLSYTPE